MKTLLRFVFIGFIPFTLNGCVAAAPAIMIAATAATTAITGYQIYSITGGGEASFSIERADPSPKSLDIIRQSKSMVIYPFQDGSDGQSIDIFREKTDLKIVSSTKTIQWIKEHENPGLQSMPTEEKSRIGTQLARAHNAHLALLIENTDQIVNSSYFPGNTTVTTKYVATLIRARTGEVLWTENHELVVREGGAPPGQNELNRVIYDGISTRIMEIRSGVVPEETQTANS